MERLLSLCEENCCIQQVKSNKRVIDELGFCRGGLNHCLRFIPIEPEQFNYCVGKTQNQAITIVLWWS